jgi:hypothetical protein
MLSDETLEGDHRAWSYAGDGALIVNITRTNVQAGIPGHVIVNDGVGLLSSVAVLDPLRGGLGTSVIPSNGQVPVGSGGVYTPALLTSDGTVIITPGPGSIHLSAPGGGGGGGGVARVVISESRWLVNGDAKSIIAVMPWRAASWSFSSTRNVYFWHEGARGFTMECRNGLNALLGTITVGASAGAIANMSLSAQLVDTSLNFTVEGDSMYSSTAVIKGLYLEAV